MLGGIHQQQTGAGTPGMHLPASTDLITYVRVAHLNRTVMCFTGVRQALTVFVIKVS